VSKPGLSEAIQDYLKELYHLQTDGGRVSVTALAREQKVSPASASGMVKKLAVLKLVEHAPYRGVKLTPAGERVAVEVIRHHRLLELYLAKTLGLHVDAVHDEADRLQHVLSDELEARIEAVSMDMSPAYWSAVLEHLPEAAIVFDRFHITKLVNEKLDDLRREMVREATGLMKQSVKGVRYLLLMRRDNVDESRLPQLQAALKHNEPLNTGYLLKEALGLLWEQPSYAQMKSYLHQWCAWAMESGVRLMQQLGKTLLGHASGILAWWKHRISNGRMEGINNKIKTLLRQTYGLRDERFFTLKLFSLHHSRLTLLG